MADLPHFIKLRNAGDDRLFWYSSGWEIKKEHTVLVSGAAGAVGSVVGQIAKSKAVRLLELRVGQKNAIT